MKLSDIRRLGRYKHKLTLQEVNIHKGRRVGRSVDIIFYLRYGGRIIVDDKEFYHDWIKVA